MPVSNRSGVSAAASDSLLPDWITQDDTLGFSGSSTGPALFAGGSTPSQALYLTETGDQTAINVNDLHQGQIGDCFLISSIGEIALTSPSFISNMIHANTDGTETVTLYTSKTGALPTFGTTAFKSVSVTVNNLFPTYGVNNGATQDVVNGTKEIWSQVAEKAVATLGGGYSSIAYGGNPMIAMEELTGHTATHIAPGSLSANLLQSYVNAGNMLVFDSANSSALPYNLVGNHAYMFEKITTVNGAPAVQLGNPWGYNQPAAIPLSQLSKAFVEIDIGHA